jgi:hypothetical protein
LRVRLPANQENSHGYRACPARAEAAFKKKQEARVEGERAMAEYKARQQAVRERTAKLRALRLMRDEAGKKMIASAKKRSD